MWPTTILGTRGTLPWIPEALLYQQREKKNVSALRTFSLKLAETLLQLLSVFMKKQEYLNRVA